MPDYEIQHIDESEMKQFNDMEYNLSYVNVGGRNGQFFLTFSKLAWDFKDIYWDSDTKKLFISFEISSRAELLQHVSTTKNNIFDVFNLKNIGM